jgi:hypothetical protein
MSENAYQQKQVPARAPELISGQGAMAGRLSAAPRAQELMQMQQLLQRNPRVTAQARLAETMNRRPPTLMRAPVLRRATNTSPAAQFAAVVQRVITFTKFETGKTTFDSNVERTPEQFAEAIRRSEAYSKLSEACKKEGITDEDEIHEQITAFVRLLADNQTVESRNAFVKQLERSAKKEFLEFLSGGGKAGEIEGELKDGATLLGLLGRAEGREALHKLSVIRRTHPKLVELVYALVERLLKKSDTVLSQVEIQQLFSKLTTSQSTRDIEEGIEGYVQAAEGIMGELAGLVHVNPEEVAEGERIYSGSEYKDTGSEDSHQQEVDISYIDRRDVLHLIEAANSLNVLKNKVLGGSAQKKNYQHLSTHAREMEQTAPGGFSEIQARQQVVRSVEFSYVIPTDEIGFAVRQGEDFSLDHLEMVDNVLRGLITANASLRIGLAGHTYTVSNLRDMQKVLFEERNRRQTRYELVQQQLGPLASRDPDTLSEMERMEKLMLQTESINLSLGKAFGR